MNKPLAACAGMLLMACSGMPVEPDLITPLEQACLRDPLNPSRWEQLAAALAVDGQRERAATMYLQAASLRTHDIRQDYAILKQARDDAVADMPRTLVRQVGPALVEVSRSVAAQPVTAANALRLEIANGNGVRGAAARLARSLQVDGVRTVRLSNLRPFDVPLSRIEYQRDRKDAAQTLARRLNMPLHPLRSGAYADMRIVLGHDVRYLK
ncbi:LytR C-terminal domain-containing protein [Duganella callida]|uniref:LytR family transcriptional regulator n=1 Tax=Duganella callida TaxID=2561932 RepID=A0A4Y9S8Z2_9BURK|nr:LytR C-terminal domain-containing protein [Duganella callida]TFW18276.1 LytR family transcriptional regulator [Duganella callida]